MTSDIQQERKSEMEMENEMESESETESEMETERKKETPYLLQQLIRGYQGAATAENK